ncbi:MAG: hypothetical protein KIT83_05825 [Bryobacterales bacterium]|nr:hypothetical protein [Bryobacterales bacterium]
MLPDLGRQASEVCAFPYDQGIGAIPVLFAPEEYLSTSFPDGDQEYVDGQLVERTKGEKDHSTAQRRTPAA